MTTMETVKTIMHNGDRQCETKTCWSMVEEMYSPHFLAQDLNNEASSLIARGENIPHAIQLLVRALESSKWCPRDDTGVYMEEPCDCEDCSLDTYIFQRDEDSNDCYDDNLHSNGAPQYKRSRTTFEQQPLHLNTQDVHEERGKAGFVYRRPFRVSQTSILENHYMGSTLSVMILFNLALAHQLLGMSIPLKWKTFEARSQNMNKALKLYELCIDACSGSYSSDAAQLRLKLLVMNNLSQIHLFSGYPKKHQMCLEYLLRATMFVSHGRDAEWDHDREILTPSEIDAIFRNMQSSSMLMGKQIHAPAA